MAGVMSSNNKNNSIALGKLENLVEIGDSGPQPTLQAVNILDNC
jgi:hypothetical protein